ncbi:MAG: hypothetical protein E7562_04160 [Ruminococcaceae bacterium]|nr:hypothetical protein [Oscillospiraceae bacterium]
MKNKNLVVIVVVSILVVALLGFGIFWGINQLGGDGDKDNGDKESSSQTDSSNKDDKPSKGDTVSGGKIETEDVKSNAGSNVTVEVKLNKNPGFNACQLFLEYDKNVMTLVGGENGNILDQFERNGDRIVIYDSDNKDNTKNGTLLTLEFAIKEDAANGEYPIKLGKDTMFANIDEKDVVPSINLGSVIVE